MKRMKSCTCRHTLVPTSAVYQKIIKQIWICCNRAKVNVSVFPAHIAILRISVHCGCMNAQPTDTSIYDTDIPINTIVGRCFFHFFISLIVWLIIVLAQVVCVVWCTRQRRLPHRWRYWLSQDVNRRDDWAQHYTSSVFIYNFSIVVTKSKTESM